MFDMVNRTKDLKPTNAELSILQVLWQRGPSTVREVHEELSKSRDTGYTTVLKLMQIMAEKGSLVRDEEERAHVYRPSQSQELSKRGLVGDLMEKAFGGSAQDLVMHALTAKKASSEDLAAIRKLLDELESKK